MTTDADRAAFLARIAAEPEEVTHRLVFADWLDSQDVPRVKCRVCGGRKRILISSEGHGSAGKSVHGTCRTCADDGTVPDTSDADRAKLIRVQCRLSGMGECGGDFSSGLSCCCRFCAEGGYTLRRREAELLAAHPEWGKCPCPACGGKGQEFAGGTFWNCEVCGGTGDLLVTTRDTGYHDGGIQYESRVIDWHAGCPRSVRCTLTEVGGERDVKCPTCNGTSWSRVTNVACPDCNWRGAGTAGTVRRFVPAPWAAALVKLVPVLAFHPAELKPVNSVTGWWWASPRTAGGSQSSVLPKSVFRLLVDGPHYALTQSYPTERAATDALALALGRLVRAAAHGTAPGRQPAATA